MFLVYDLETTALDTASAEILEIAISSFDRGVVYHQYVYPSANNIDNSDIHGITMDVLYEKGCILVAQNLIFLDNLHHHLKKLKNKIMS